MYPRYISAHRTLNNDEVLIIVDNISYIEDNKEEGTTNISFVGGGGFEIKESYEKIVEDLTCNVKVP